MMGWVIGGILAGAVIGWFLYEIWRAEVCPYCEGRGTVISERLGTPVLCPSCGPEWSS